MQQYKRFCRFLCRHALLSAALVLRKRLKMPLQNTHPCSQGPFPWLGILVPRAHDPSGLRQESRALGATISGMRHRCRLPTLFPGPFPPELLFFDSWSRGTKTLGTRLLAWGRGGKRSWHRLVTRPSYTPKSWV